MTSVESLLEKFVEPKSVDEIRNTILIIDDDKSIQRGLQRYFKYKYHVIVSASAVLGIEALSKNIVHCIILDIKMKEMSGFDVYPKLKNIVPDIPIIFYTGFHNEYDIKLILNKYNPLGYFGKGDNISTIEATLDEAVTVFKKKLDERKITDTIVKELDREKQQTSLLKRRLHSRYQFDTLKGTSPKMMALKQFCEKAIHSDITVLIQAETGTGKELVAKIIHSNSHRSDHNFFIQNCAAIPEHLFESELFGHKKGSFTGAIADKKGLFGLADKGTVFLDEIGDLSLAMQAKLLRLLQDGEIRPVGGDTNKYVDVRIISATNKSLAKEVKAGRFREDLYYRLNVFTICPPPLREMKEDIPLLVRFFLNKYTKKNMSSVNSISDNALEILMNYPFPGNIRQLENEVERAMVMVDNAGIVIKARHLSDHIIAKNNNSFEFNGNGKSLKERVIMFEKKMIKQALERNNGNKTHTAKALGISRVGLNSKIRRYKIT